MDELKLIVASNIIKLRTGAGMTQAELGEKLNYSDKTVSKWERAESIPDVFVIKQMAEIFGVTVDFIITSHDGWQPDASDEQNGITTHSLITTVTLLGIFTVAFLIFTIFWILGDIFWEIFFFALPIALIVWLILHSIWRGGKYNPLIVFLLVLSIFVVVYITLRAHNPWQLFVVAIPAELIVVLSSIIVKKVKNR